MLTSNLSEGRAVFKRWSNRFRKRVRHGVSYADDYDPTADMGSPYFLFRTYNDIREICSDYYGDYDKTHGPIPYDMLRIPELPDIEDQVEFFKAYFFGILYGESIAEAFDDHSNFPAVVKKIIANHNSRDWRKGYSFHFYLNNFHLDDREITPYFDGYNANIFCNEITDVDFRAVISVMPFDNIAIRNKGGHNWSELDVSNVIRHINGCLGSDLCDFALLEDSYCGNLLFCYNARAVRKDA